jgi:hypothetical protein
MKEAVPAWEFLLSDAYFSRSVCRTSLTALQVGQSDTAAHGIDKSFQRND